MKGLCLGKNIVSNAYPNIYEGQVNLFGIEAMETSALILRPIVHSAANLPIELEKVFLIPRES